MKSIKEYKWQPRAACLSYDPEVFFDESGLPESQPTVRTKRRREIAKKICATCPVMRECRATFIGEPYGVYGGMDQEERARWRRNRGKRERRYEESHRDSEVGAEAA